MKKLIILSLLFLGTFIASQAQTINKMYTFKQSGNKFIVSITNHNEISKAITAFCEDQKIKAGTINGIGAINRAVLRFFNPVTKKYVDKTFSEQMEISNLTGNISQMNGKLYLHLHITLGRSDYSALAGHLLEADINGAGEFVIEKIDENIDRYHDEAIGLNMYKF